MTLISNVRTDVFVVCPIVTAWMMGLQGTEKSREERCLSCVFKQKGKLGPQSGETALHMLNQGMTLFFSLNYPQMEHWLALQMRATSPTQMYIESMNSSKYYRNLNQKLQVIFTDFLNKLFLSSGKKLK